MVVYEATTYNYLTFNYTPPVPRHVFPNDMLGLGLYCKILVKYLIDMHYILVSNYVGRSMCTWEDAPVGAPAQYKALWGDI